MFQFAELSSFTFSLKILLVLAKGKKSANLWQLHMVAGLEQETGLTRATL